MNGYCVYKHTAPNGKVYIGITCQKPSDRFANGKGYKKNEHFSRAIRKYGWSNFKHEIVVDGLTLDEANNKEIELIAASNSTNSRFGYNNMSGGNQGAAASADTRKRRSRASKKNWTSAEYREKISMALTGIARSDETRQKMSLAKLGKSHCQPTKWVAVEQIDKDTGQTIRIFGSISEASNATGATKANICSCCKGNRRTTSGYKWRYAA